MASSCQPAEEGPHQHASSQCRGMHNTAMSDVENAEDFPATSDPPTINYVPDYVPDEETPPPTAQGDRPREYLRFIYDTASSDEEIYVYPYTAPTSETSTSFSPRDAGYNNEKHDAEGQTSRHSIQISHDSGNIPAVTTDRAAEGAGYKTTILFTDLQRRFLAQLPYLILSWRQSPPHNPRHHPIPTCLTIQTTKAAHTVKLLPDRAQPNYARGERSVRVPPSITERLVCWIRMHQAKQSSLM